jgi:DNA mismatch repair protein MutS2
MKLDGLIDDQSAERLGFAWLEAAIAPVSAYGARAFAQLRPYRPGEERAAFERATEIEGRARSLSSDRVGATLGAIAALPDIAPIVARAAIGEVLDDPDFYELLHFCEGVQALDGIGNASTRAVAAALSPGQFAAGAFCLADAFDDALNAARSAMSDAQAEFEAVRGRERAAVAASLGRDEIAGDEFIVMRGDLHGSLPAGVRVLREAATYLSCALELGEASLQALQRRDAAISAVADVEARARRRLSETARDNAVGLNAAVDVLAALDVTLAAVRYTQRYRCTVAEIAKTPALAFEAARFLPLEEQLERASMRFVPIDLALKGPAVITGPNMGGKTVAMQTCGFITLAAAFGLPVPAQNARVALFDRIAWLGVGRDEPHDGLLSSFAIEIVALKSVLDAGVRSLAVFIDEFARTTSPAEGSALTVALLERLNETNARGLAATHLPGVAKAAQVPHFAVRDYHIVEVEGDEASDGEAIALAQSLGMDERFIAAAHEALKGTAWIR